MPGRVLNKFLYGADPPRGPTPYLFIYDFFFIMKKVPLSHTLLRTLHFFAFEVRERNPQFALGVVYLNGCPVQLIREVILRLHFRRRRHTFASL